MPPAIARSTTAYCPHYVMERFPWRRHALSSGGTGPAVEAAAVAAAVA
eukprot:CAMPEP_0119326914 /NCGR_PEP_ID=MMETSP1333-20130426/69584_1 /TAXON_ID=418940 /ORGANISM="Scyphosphaera apsteinii, Strain RCC1455" /LENGTH=47 /DNA_ID= /DNA_START= /DNA_END= /DNA_ORIENTATION=